MIQKKKRCNGCDSEQFIWKNEGGGLRYCKSCWARRGVAKSITNKVKPTSATQQKPIPTRSSKRQLQEIAYSALREAFLKQHPICQFAIEGVCTINSTDVHHISRRDGDRLNDSSEWISGCRLCHSYVETEMPREEAERRGFLKSRLHE